MNLFAERRREKVGNHSGRSQLVTLAVDTGRGRGDADPIRPVLGAVKGVEAVEPDPATTRVWVFGDGGVEPESLVEALASWGYGAYVLDNELGMPA